MGATIVDIDINMKMKISRTKYSESRFWFQINSCYWLIGSVIFFQRIWNL